jgi:hypothetical protein
MTVGEDRKRAMQARDLGEQARRAGRPKGANPYRGHTALVRTLHYEWFMGWDSADAAIRAKR